MSKSGNKGSVSRGGNTEQYRSRPNDSTPCPSDSQSDRPQEDQIESDNSGVVTDLQQGDSDLVAFDGDLLERSRTQWQFGDWKSLCLLNRDALQSHPDRARLAVLAAAGNIQQGKVDRARQFVKLAQGWGCSKRLISHVLIAGVHNSLGGAAAANGEDERSMKHFETSIAIVTPRSDTQLLGRLRCIRESTRLGLLSEAANLMSGELSEITHHPPVDPLRVKHLEEELELIKSKLSFGPSPPQEKLSAEQQKLMKCLATTLISLPRSDAVGIRLEISGRTVARWGCDGIDVEDDLEKALRDWNRRDLDDQLSVVLALATGVEECVTAHPGPTSSVSASAEEAIAAVTSVTSDRYQKYIRSNSSRVLEDAAIVARLFPRQASVLDIGSVPPLFPALLSSKGFQDVSVVDPDASSYQEYLSSIGVEAIDGDILDDLPIDRKYDLVTFCEVIEHMTRDLRRPLENIVDCVKNGGYFFITTPNLRSVSGLVGLNTYQSGLASKYLETVRRQFDRISSDGYPGHVREYTEKEVIDLVESFGFVHESSYYQPDYRGRNDPVSKLIYVLETRFPELALFGKYLFKKV